MDGRGLESGGWNGTKRGKGERERVRERRRGRKWVEEEECWRGRERAIPAKPRGEKELCTKRGGKDAGAQDAGRRCSTTLHWQLHPSHTRYEPCSRATLHRDTRRTIVASAPTGGTSSSSIFVPVDVRLRCVPRVPSNATKMDGPARSVVTRSANRASCS